MQNEGCLNISETKKDSITSHISNLSFKRPNPIWNKNCISSKQNPECGQEINNKQKYKFYKVGKTLGLQVYRYLKFHNNILYYYEDRNNHEYKGFCNLHNLYMRYTQTGSGLVMELSNGHTSTTLQFNNNQFWKSFQSQIIKQVIQLNFRQKYTIQQLIGEGTFSKVYSVVNRKTKQKYAAKIIPKSDQNGYNTKHIVEEQKKILNKLNSNYICKMYQFYEQTNNYIFVLQYLEGKDLNVLLKQYSSKLTINQRIMIIKQTLQALNEIHKHNIIHRDIKPHNIFVNLKNHSVKLIDFGLSLMYDNKTDLHKFIKCGTVGFIAPQIINNEQANRHRYDCKSDMFGFGIVVHMVLMGNNPIRCKKYQESIQKNKKALIALDQKQISQAYGINCFKFIQKLLKKESNQRFTSNQALKSQFFQQRHKYNIDLTHLDTCEEQHINKSDQQNIIEDKTFIATSSILAKNKKDQTDRKKRKTQKFTGMF